VEAGQALQFGSTWLLNLAFALMLGLLSAHQWLADAEGARGGALRRRLERLWRPAALACLAGQLAALWAAAAAMAGVEAADAGPALLTMLGATVFGKAGLLGLAAAATLAAAGASPLRSAAGRSAALVLLALFALARAANSHAAEQGLASFGLLVEWIHLVGVALWLGAVGVGAWLVMRDTRHAPVRYMERLSGAATLAIAAIAASGVYNSWHGLGSPAQALGNPYGTVLMVKLALVLLAAAMGGYNKLVAFPRALDGNLAALGRARLVLQIESLVLAGAMLAAAVLVTQQPPAMA
jgi:putative copper export protein